MSFIEKILKYIDYKRISKANFYRQTGLSNGFLDKDRDFGVSKLVNILNTYDDLRVDWLLFDKGEMLTKTENVLQKVAEPLTNYEKKSSELKMCQDLVEMQKEYIENLKRQLADCRKDLNSQKNAG